MSSIKVHSIEIQENSSKESKLHGKFLIDIMCLCFYFRFL